jgi:hypothetical protein
MGALSQPVPHVRRRPTGLCLGLGLWLVLASAGPVLAQLPEGIDLRAALPGFDGTDAELEAFFALISQRHIRARELAQKVLDREPTSFVAHYVLGEVEHDAEANFPRAVFHLERAKELYEARFGVLPRDGAPQRWHPRILMALANAYGELDQHEKKLALLAHYNDMYEPDALAERAWPLMKERRFDEARSAVQEALATGDLRQREIALNSLCAIEFEAGDDVASYAACKRAMDNARGLGSELDPADLMNFAEASRSVFKLDEAERIDREATEVATAWYGNPWSELAELYTREGRLSEALSSLREVPKYRAQRPPHVRESDRNENRRALSAFFILLGRPDDALRITQKALIAPDRRGHNSRDPAQDRSIAALLDRAAHGLKAERLREAAAAAPLYLRILQRAQARYEELSAWLSARRAMRALDTEARLVGTLQIGTARAAVMPPWLATDLAYAGGAGALRAAVAAARKADPRTTAGSYYDAFDGEAAYLAGDFTAAETALMRAIGGLPQAEQLLRARCLAVLAALRFDSGRVDLALEDFERTIQLDPSVLRRLSLTLPVRVSNAVGDAADDVEDAIGRSPRFDVGRAGLPLELRGDGAGLSVCLRGVSGAELACGTAPRKADESAADYTARLMAEVHDHLFAPRIDLSQVDASSLDGSNLRGNVQDLSPLLEGAEE